MNRMSRIFGIFLLLFLLLSPLLGRVWDRFDSTLDDWADQLAWESADQSAYLELGIQTDLWLYYTDTAGGPPGFWFPPDGDTWTVSPRFTLTADAFLGDNLYGFFKFRLDDGVHPGVGRAYGDSTQTRIDELFIRYSGSELFTFQIGQYTPIFGNFLSRQNSWDMGLISYPHLYEGVTSVSDFAAAPNAAEFAARRNTPDSKLTWLPIVWAPLYSMGATAFGNWEGWGYAINFMNSAPSSRGLAWNNIDFTHPSWILRLERKFGPDLTIGINYNNGPYFRVDRESVLPPGTTLSNFRQTFYSLDIAWAYRKFQVWGELFYNTFDIPNVGDDAEILSYYLEGRWSFAQKWWASLRWNQETYNQILTNPATEEDWDNPLYRVDLGLGFRYARHGQIKVQYSFQEQDADFQNGRHFIVSELTFKL